MFTFKVSTKYGFVKAGDVNVGITSGNADHFTGVISFGPSGPTLGLAFFQTLTQGARRRMGVVAEIAHVIHGPALAFLNHQHFVFPALGALFQLHAQGNIARVAIRDGRGAGDIALSAGVVLLEKRFDCSRALLDGS